MRFFQGFIFFIFIAALTGGCGYKIAGFNPKNPIKFYVERVVNDTIDTRYGDIVQQTADRYFITYGEAASYEKATYFLAIRLSAITFAEDIVTATDEAVNANAVPILEMVVTNRENREVFSATYKPSVSFNVASNVSASVRNRDAAINEAVVDALDLFRNAFNSLPR